MQSASVIKKLEMLEN